MIRICTVEQRKLLVHLMLVDIPSNTYSIVRIILGIIPDLLVEKFIPMAIFYSLKETATVVGASCIRVFHWHL